MPGSPGAICHLEGHVILEYLKVAGLELRQKKVARAVLSDCNENYNIKRLLMGM